MQFVNEGTEGTCLKGDLILNLFRSARGDHSQVVILVQKGFLVKTLCNVRPRQKKHLQYCMFGLYLQLWVLASYK